METDLTATRKRRIEVFFEQSIPVHIVTESDSWINGFITYVGSDFCMVLDRIDKKDIPVFFNDIHKLEMFDGDFKTLPRKEDLK